ncbi:MAG: hypothetical protein KAR40_06550 [Candidatus Sabulitectum sp.]|nr:hypothetical protein [Candidatus Sabulitectum sp.]
MIVTLCCSVLLGYSSYSAGEIMLDRFLANDGMTYMEFHEEFEDFQNDQWGRPSSRGWLARMYDWESEIPAMRGISRLLSRIDLSREQYYYLDALTFYVEFHLEAIRSTYGLDSGRMDFFQAFTDDMYMETTVYFAFEERQWYQSEMNDLMAWTMGMVNDMLSTEQLDDARYIVEWELQSWNVRDSWSCWYDQWRNDPRRDYSNPGRRSGKY